jgi:hypothetical protein
MVRGPASVTGMVQWLTGLPPTVARRGNPPIASIQERHDPLVGVEAGRREPSRFSEVAHEMAIRRLHVGFEYVVRQRVEAPAPDDVVHAAMETQLVTLGLHRMQQRNEGEPHRPGQRGFQDEPGPAGLLDEMDRLAVGQLGLGARGALPDPLQQVGGAAHVDEEGVGDTEVAADFPNSGEPVGSADSMINVPAEGEQPFGHCGIRLATSR